MPYVLLLLFLVLMVMVVLNIKIVPKPPCSLWSGWALIRPLGRPASTSPSPCGPVAKKSP